MGKRAFGSAIVLAGGRSLRMGFAKENMAIGGRRLLCCLTEQLSVIFEQVLVASSTLNEAEGCGCLVVPDDIPGLGPLGGLHAALRRASGEYAYVTACDMPEICTPYIRYMADLIVSASEPPLAVVTAYRDHIEPFNAFYSTALVEHIERCAQRGHRSISSLLSAVNVMVVPEAEARRFSPDWGMFLNLNTPEDFYRYMKKKAERKRCH